MKTIEIYKIPDSLKEVWEWKETTFKELYGKSIEEKKSILKNARDEAAETIVSKLIKLPNGNFRIE